MSEYPGEGGGGERESDLADLIPWEHIPMLSDNTLDSCNSASSLVNDS